MWPIAGTAMSDEASIAARDAAESCADAAEQFTKLAKLFAEAAAIRAAGRKTVDLAMFSARLHGQAVSLSKLTQAQAQIFARPRACRFALVRPESDPQP